MVGFVPLVVFTMVLIWMAVLALAMGSILPLMVIGLPRLYGAWHHVLTGVALRLGERVDVGHAHPEH